MHRFSFEPDSPKVNGDPIELQEIKLQPRKPFMESKEVIPEKFKLWHAWSQEKILTAIEEKNLDKLIFFVGPAFDLILRQYENEMYEELDKAYFLRNCAEIMHERIVAGIQIFCAIKHNEAMLKDREIKLSEAKALNENLKLIESLIKSHTEVLIKVKEKGLLVYREWYNHHQRSIEEFAEGTMLGLPEYNCTPDSKIQMTDIMKSEIREFLSMWVKPWIRIQIQNDWYISGLTKEEIETEINKIYDNLINSLLDCSSLEGLKGKLKAFAMDQKIAVNEKILAFKKQIKKERKRYREFASVFLKEGDNRRLVKDFLLSNDFGFCGMTVKELIDMIAEYKFSVVRCYSGEVWLEKMAASIDKIENVELRAQMEGILEQHCLTPRLKLALRESLLVYQRLNQTQLAHPTTGNVDKELIAYNAEVVKKARSVALKTSIKDPLSETQLRMIIDRFSCTNQRQVCVKKLLKRYLNNEYDSFSRAWVKSFFMGSKSIKRRRETEYLISSLYFVAMSETESGCFGIDQESEKSILAGLNAILKLINCQWRKYNRLERLFYYSWLSELQQHAKVTDLASQPHVSEAKRTKPPQTTHLYRFSLLHKKPQLLWNSKVLTYNAKTPNTL